MVESGNNVTEERTAPVEGGLNRREWILSIGAIGLAFQSALAHAGADESAEGDVHKRLEKVLSLHYNTLMNWGFAREQNVQKVKEDLRRALGLPDANFYVTVQEPRLQRRGAPDVPDTEKVLTVTVHADTTSLVTHASISRKPNGDVSDVVMHPTVDRIPGRSLNALCKNMLSSLDERVAALRLTIAIIKEEGTMVVDVMEARSGMPVGRFVCDEQGKMMMDPIMNTETMEKLAEAAKTAE